MRQATSRVAMAGYLLVAMIVAGLGLSGAHVRALFISWRRYETAERKREISLGGPQSDQNGSHFE